MKSLKKILILLLSLSLVFALFACGKCKHEDEDKNGICDLCGEEVEIVINDVALIEEGVANFQFVMEEGVTGDVVKAVDQIVKALKQYDLDVKKVNDKADNETTVEVLVGDVTTRGDKYKIDKHTLGSKGYVIKIVDSKIIINAGSYAQLADAIEIFGDEILGLAEEPDELWEVIMTAEQIVEEIQGDYRITSLKVNGNSLQDYTIAIDLKNTYHKSAAESLQNLLYERTGYWLEIVSLDKADKSIVFQKVEKSDKNFPNGFEMSVNDKSQIVVKCSYDNRIEDGIAKFTSAKIVAASGDIEFTTGVLVDNFNASIILYEDFGAKGDGKTNDYESIYNAHVKANEGGQTVYATAGKTYYLESPVIDGQPKSIPVTTNVDWRGAKFIIDDSKIHVNAETKKWNVPVFSIEQSSESYSYSKSNANHKDFLASVAAQLKIGATKIDLGDSYNCPVMLITENATHRVYRRRTYSGFTGAAMEEVIILDKDGKIVGNSNVMYDYIDLTGLSVTKLDEIEPITLKNGEFTTIAAKANCIKTGADGYRSVDSAYTTRGLNITRSYTTVENIKHNVTGELPLLECIDQNNNNRIICVPPCYRGFYVARKCTDVTVKDCTLTGRRAYRRPDGGTGGTYDLSAGLTNKLVFENCVQTNFWVTVDEKYNVKHANEGDVGAINGMNAFPGITSKVDDGRILGSEMHWGIGGTNLCKNTEYINSTLSRYDAHEGTYSGKVVGSTVCTVALTGAGDFLIENSRIIPDGSRNVFSTRGDYGYTWDGSVTIKNVTSIIDPWEKKDGVPTGKYADDICVTSAKYESRNWYWGYHPSMPSVIIEDLYFCDVTNYNAKNGTYEELDTTVPIYLYGKTTISADFEEHLSTTTNEPIYSVENKDSDEGDRFVDIPDIDGDGEWGNIQVEYNAIKAALDKKHTTDEGFTLSEIDASLKPQGYVDPSYHPDTGRYDNFSQVKPPKYAKILSNKGGYKYYVCNTATSGVESGSHHGVSENGMGFYGCTKFYYSENGFYIGPVSTTSPDDKVFVFY